MKSTLTTLLTVPRGACSSLVPMSSIVIVKVALARVVGAHLVLSRERSSGRVLPVPTGSGASTSIPIVKQARRKLTVVLLVPFVRALTLPRPALLVPSRGIGSGLRETSSEAFARDSAVLSFLAKLARLALVPIRIGRLALLSDNVADIVASLPRQVSRNRPSHSQWRTLSLI